MISGATNFNIQSPLTPKMMFGFVVVTLFCAALIFLFRNRKANQGSTSSNFQHTPGMPKIPKHTALPVQQSGGRRQLDELELSPQLQAKRTEAYALIEKGQISEGAQLLDSINLKREAIDVLEARGRLDEAAALLMSINRPNRAAVLYERNKKFEKAAVYYLKAKLVDDAKRCCKQIQEFSLALSTELAVLFAEAGDNKSALRLLAGINDKNRILKIVREKFAYTDLAEFLDYPAARQLLLSSITQTDVDHMLQNLPNDPRTGINRAILWVSESKKPEWLTPVFMHIGDKRGVASGFIEKIAPEITKAYADYISKMTVRDVEMNKQPLEWAARALHDSMRMLPAGMIYEKLNLSVLAGKCFAIAGEAQRALGHLTSPEGDLSLATTFQQELDRLGRFTTDQKPLAQHERDALVRVFFNIDPDTEKNRVHSPFSIAS